MPSPISKPLEMTIPVAIPITHIEAPQVQELLTTETSGPAILEPYHVDLLPEYGYTSREYLISGVSAGDRYCTRILLRCPSDVSRFSGIVVAEPAHIWSGTSIWRATNRWLMRNGHAWLEVDCQAPVAMGSVKASDPVRYADMYFPPGPICRDFRETIPFTPNPTRQTLEDEYSAFMLRWWAATPQSNEVLAAASYALRSGVLGLIATRVFLSGLSQTGGVTRRYLTHGSHLRLPNGQMPFEGLIPCASGGAALPDPPSGVKVIELLGEAEFQSVRWSCGVSGQARGTTHRRADSDSFRLYEVAGMAHRESRYASKLDMKRFSSCDIGGAVWSSFPNSFLYAAVFQAMVDWTSANSVPPPPGAILQTIGKTDEIKRDEHGNAIGGVRNLHVDVPTSRVVAATPMGRPNWYWGSEWLFDVDQLRARYGTVATYRAEAGQAIQKQIDSGFLLPEDAEILRRETVESVRF